MNDKILLSRKDAAEAISVSLRKLDYLVANAVLKAIKLGKRTLIPRAELEKLAKTGCGKTTGAEG